MTVRAARPLAGANGAIGHWSLDEALPTVLVGVGYFAGSLAGFALRLPGSGISILWPPTAILTAALLLGPARARVQYLVAALIAHGVAHTFDGLPAANWLALFAANALQAVVAVFLVRRYSDSAQLFRSLRSVTVFIVGACIIAPATASIVAAFVYVYMGWAGDFFHAWSARVLSNFIASVTIVPPVMMTVQHVRSRAAIPLRSLLHFVALLAALIVTFALATDFWPNGAPGVPLSLYIPIPFLLWAAVRLGPAELSGAVLAATLLAISSALRGKGPFTDVTPVESVAAVQVFVAMTVVPMMLMAGLIEESRRERRTILESEHRTSAILRSIPDLMFLLSRDGTYLSYYASSTEELLVSPDSFIGKNMRDVLPPDLASDVRRRLSEGDDRRAPADRILDGDAGRPAPL